MKKITKLFLEKATKVAWGNSFKRLAIVAIGIMALSSNSFALTNYCAVAKTSTNGLRTLNYTCQNLGGTSYEMKLEFQDVTTGTVNANIGANPGPVNVATNKVWSNGNKTLTFTFTAASNPTLYVATIFVTISGAEARWDLPQDANFAAVCSTGPADTTLPVMGAASVVGSPTFNSVNLLLAATDDITTPVTSFVANDAANSITNKAITADASGNGTVTGLAASTSYNLIITAKDASGNISANSTTVSFTTPVEPALSTIDFETVGQDWTWVIGENAPNTPALEFVDNPSATGINTSTKVAKFTANSTGQPWALTTTTNRTFTITDNNKIVKVMVYKDRISDFGFKYEGPGYVRELKVANTLINQWEELTFNFGADVGKTVNLIVIIPDFLARTTATINYFDNISFSPVSDITPPVMGTASVVGSPAFNSVNLLLTATDNVTSPVTSFVANDVTNGITDKAFTADALGNATVSGLTALTSYNLVIKAKDASGNISANSTTVSFTTSAPPAVSTINFETVGQDWTWIVTENSPNTPALEFVDNPSATGINTSTKVAKFTANATGNAWALVYSSSRPYVVSTDNKIIKVMVYKDRISDFGLKLETTSGDLELKVANTLINTWEELTFDFSSKIGSTANVIVFIPDFLARTVATINYFDNISFSNGLFSSLGSKNSDNSVRCYPNPMNNTLNVSSSTEINQVIIRNMLGQTVKIININQLEKSIDLNSVSAGNYFVSVRLANGQLSTRKIVKL